MRNFVPKTRNQDQNLITRVQGDMDGQPDFSGGMFDDGIKVPPNGVKYLTNYRSHGTYIEGRGGTKKHSTTTPPSIPGRTGYTYTSTVVGTTRTIVKTVGDDFSQTDEDNERFFVLDTGVHERITNYTNVTTITTLCATGSAANDGVAGWVRGRINARHFHKSQEKLVVMFDGYVYITDPNTIAYVRVFNISSEDPTSAFSRFAEFKQYVFLFNSNGIYKIDISATVPLMFKCNSYSPTVKVTDQNVSTQGVVTLGYPYGRRYIYTLSRITGVTGLRDRTTASAVIEQESGPVLADQATSYKDFGAVYSTRPIGDGSTDYGVLTGGALGASYDTAAEWAALGTNCTFTITLNGTAKNCSADMTDVLTMDDVAERLQVAMRSVFNTATYSSTATCDYSTDHFVITNPDEETTGSTPNITVTSAGVGGTDIGTAAMSCQTGAGGGTVTTPAYTADNVIGTLTVPVNSGGSIREKHWTHYSVYGTLDIGDNGYDPVNGLANPKELYIWLFDVHTMRAFTVDSVAVTSGIITLESGQVFAQNDVGATLSLADKTTGATTSSVISYLSDAAGAQVYTATSRYAVGTLVTAKTAQMGGFGGVTLIYGSQAVSGTETVGASTITRSVAGAGAAFTANDVNRIIYCEDGSEQHIVRFVSATVVEVAENATKTNKVFCRTPVSRNCSDQIPDSTAQYRAATLLLKNRFWEPLPSADLGTITSGFMFSALTTGRVINYSQMPDAYEYMVGYYNPAFQTTHVKDIIVDLVDFTDLVTVFCKNSTYEIPTNTFSSQTLEQVGEVVIIIAGIYPINEYIGAFAVKKTYRGDCIVITSEPGIRLFSGRGYGENIIENKIMDKLKAMQNRFLISYDPVNGMVFWGLN